MKVTVTVSDKYIGNGKGASRPVSSWRKHPANFDAAAKAAAHYAKRDNENYAVIWGSMYGAGLYRIMRPAELDRLPRPTGRYQVAIAKPDGDLFYGVAVYEVVKTGNSQETGQ